MTGVARSPGKQADLAAVGGRPVELDLFDREAVDAAVAGHDVVFNLATAIPVGDRASIPSAWQDNDRIRREAPATWSTPPWWRRVSRYVQESIAFMYADGGDRWLASPLRSMPPAPRTRR